ncbi:MAG TPA: alpha/beta hydrolase-fold protein [Actinocrinis sp.]|uniref:alpha/beta hydrolase n=1 Tax=Actinocrinis sp. TaxID=1920516 RepID=UPI002D407148|nr:alpha/beta hydrolase-fold protein [Actinocrinis sp.]HZU58114.1 alpha/beta hydrolase-fold protein [Actinocrinis sp.]
MPTKRNRTLIAALTLALAAGPAVALSAPAHAATTATTTPAPAMATADDGASVVSANWLDSRMVDLQISSPAVGATVPVRMLVPPGWSPSASRTWPVLYLLQGAHDDYTSWTRETNIESFTATRNVIVVMPSAGPTGIPTQWFNGGKDSPDYEAFQVTEVWQLLQRDYRAGTVRSVAGVSTGGYGAVMMAEHHPGAFAGVACYSGILNTTFFGMPQVLDAIVMRENLDPTSLWGDPTANAALWAADNPYAHIANLSGTALFISQGTGTFNDPNQTGGVLESTLFPQFISFLSQLGSMPATVDWYLGGVHDWSSWQGEFTKSWPLLASSLGLPS